MRSSCRFWASPDPDGVVTPARGDSPAVGAEDEAPDYEAMAPQEPNRLAGGRVPEPYIKFVARRRQQRTVWAVGDSLHRPLMPREICQGLPCFDVPRSSQIPGGGRDRAAVGTEGHGIDPAIRERDRAEQPAGGDIPERDLVIVRVSFPASGGEPRAVRAEGHGPGNPMVGLERGSNDPWLTYRY